MVKHFRSVSNDNQSGWYVTEKQPGERNQPARQITFFKIVDRYREAYRLYTRADALLESGDAPEWMVLITRGSTKT